MKRDWFFWAVIAISTVALVGTFYLYVQRAPMVEERLTTLRPLDEQQLELFRARVEVLLTVSTLVFGGAGALLLHFHEKQSGSLGQQRWAISALLAAGLSVGFGYFAYDAAIWMLQQRFFNLDTVALRAPATAQVLTSSLAVIFLATCFLAASTSMRGTRK